MKSFLLAKGFLLTCALALCAVAGLVTPAAADFDNEWAMRALNKASADRAPTTRQTESRATRATRTARAARTDDGDERPQRRASSTRSATGPVISGGSTLSGVASYYWQPQPVASGGRFNPNALTAAHKTLPFGTRVRVTRQDNGRSVDVTINDRGPYIAGRIIDLSRRAAEDIGMTGQGVARVSVQIIGR